MQPCAVVEGYIAAQHRCDLAVVSEAQSVNRLALHRMGEGLDVGVVGDLPRAIHALNDPQLGQPLREHSGSVLDAPVGMEDQTVAWSTIAHRAIERAERETHVL